MSFSLIESHFLFYKSTKGHTSGWLGSSPRRWFAWVKSQMGESGEILDGVDASLLPSDQIRRSELFNLIQTKNIDTLTCCIAILAWGGMNRKHGLMLFSSSRDWLDVAEKVRNGQLNRAASYCLFAQLRASGQMPGMRPAYFTKLIFFLMPMGMPRGYIMDQWTSSSVNLLFVEKIVKTAVQRTYLKSGSVKISESVLDKNTEFEYETYCQAVEFLAAELGDISPEEAEEMMFSQGRGRGLWRSYLISNRV